MASYKVILTVRDSYGQVKEVDGGTIDVAFAGLSQSDLAKIEDALPLEDYAKKAELDMYATDVELKQAIDANTAIKYDDLEFISQ